MSNLMRFMMTVIALALLSSLNSGSERKKSEEAGRKLVIPSEKRLPV
jgi:hypothetical protein